MEEPMRVAQVIGKMASGGVESVVYNYYRAMDHNEIQFDFFVDEDSTAKFPQDLLDMGARVYVVPPYQKMVRYHRELYRLFKENRYRIVHSHINTLNIFPLFAAWRAGVPVRICHNHSTAHWGEGMKTLLKYILRPFNKIFATDYFACGETAGRWMYGDRCFDVGKVTVMPNAIDTEKFAFDPEARVRLREELGIPQDVFVVGHVGRFTYQKNHSFLVDIFAELLKEKPDARLLLIGEGELMGQIQEKVRRLGIEGSVIFTGARGDVNKLYSVMDVFCLPSFYEGMPVVALEAQANGLPCVFSDQVSKESKISLEFQFLDINQALNKWVELLLHSKTKRKGSNIVPDIKKKASVIKTFYIRRGSSEESIL